MTAKLLLFDIDGTLVLTQGAGQRAMVRAGQQLFGDTFAFAVDTAGKLDLHIFAELERHNQHLNVGGKHEDFKQVYLELIKEELYANDTRAYALPGALALLEQLASFEHLTLGLLTGNYGESARLKLEASGIHPGQFPVTAFGDEAATRPALVQVALKRYHALTGKVLFPQDVIVIGDTPKDIDCAKQNKCVAVGVTTGKYDRKTLERAGADIVIDSLTDKEVLLQLLF